MERLVKLVGGLWRVPLSQGPGGVIMAEGEQVGGQINCPNPHRDVALSLKHKRKALLGQCCFIVGKMVDFTRWNELCSTPLSPWSSTPDSLTSLR
jgi:hypothetical protein